MRVLIIGCGNAGQTLAEKLSSEMHDVIVVDRRAEALAQIRSHLDVLTIEGEGSSPQVLEEANIAKADMVVAVTDRDEVNILACVIAHSVGVPHKVARVSNLDYIHPPERFNLKNMGIDMIVSQKEECAHELFNILRMPGSLEVVDLLGNRVMASGIKIHMDSPLLRAPLKKFPQPELLQSIRFIALVRGNEVIVPRGDTQFLIGDDVYFVGRPEDVYTFLEWAWPEHSSFKKVLIAGGDDLALHLAQLLENTPMRVVLVEQDEARANYCSGILNRTLVLKGNPLDQETLKNAGIIEETAFVAATDSDENNIIGCLLAGDMKARFTLAQVTKPEYVPIIDSLSLLDRAVSPPLSMINAILHFIRGKHVKAAALFHKLPGELLDVVIPPKGKWAGKAIKDIKMPNGVTIATVLREDLVLVATGDLTLEERDRLIIFSPPAAVSKLDALFRSN